MRISTSSEHAKTIPRCLIDAFVSPLEGELMNPRSKSNYRNALRAVERFLFGEILVMRGDRLRDCAGRQEPAALRVLARHDLDYFSVFRSFLSRLACPP